MGAVKRDNFESNVWGDDGENLVDWLVAENWILPQEEEIGGGSSVVQGEKIVYVQEYAQPEIIHPKKTIQTKTLQPKII